MNLAQDYSTPAVTGPTPPASSDLGHSILRTLAYSDLFDYPLTAEEIWRYQAGTEYAASEVAEALAGDPILRARVSNEGDFYCLSGREDIFAIRVQRARASRRVWRRARAYGRIVSRLPFVRMVAVTGALAMDNLGDRPDIDFLVVTEAGRVWGLRAHSEWRRSDRCPRSRLSGSRVRARRLRGKIAQRLGVAAFGSVSMVPALGLPVRARGCVWGSRGDSEWRRLDRCSRSRLSGSGVRARGCV